MRENVNGNSVGILKSIGSSALGCSGNFEVACDTNFNNNVIV